MGKAVLRQLTYTDKTLTQIRKENKVFEWAYKVYFAHKDDYDDYPVTNGVAIFNEALYQCTCACNYADPQEELTKKLECYSINASFIDYSQRVMVFCIVYIILSLREGNSGDVELYLSALERYLNGVLWFDDFKVELNKQKDLGKQKIELPLNPVHPRKLDIEATVWKWFTDDFQEQKLDWVIKRYKNRPKEEQLAIIDVLENAYKATGCELPF